MPRYCEGCDSQLYATERFMCSRCRADAPVPASALCEQCGSAVEDDGGAFVCQHCGYTIDAGGE